MNYDYMTDFLNNKINVGDKVIYLKNVRTGSSTIRKCQFKGTVVGFTECKVCIDSNDNKIFPCDIFVVNTPKMNWISVEDKLPQYNQDVLTYVPSMGMPFIIQAYCRYYSGNNEWCDHWQTNNDVTYWCELTAPKEN